MLAGLLTGVFHTAMGIPAILSGILTQLSLYSINLAIMDFKANQGINVTKYDLLVSQRNVRSLSPDNLAAVIISDVLFGRLFINFALKLVGVSIGAVIYYIVIQIVLWLGLNTNLLKLLSALIVAVFLAVPYWKNNLAAHRETKGGRGHA